MEDNCLHHDVYLHTYVKADNMHVKAAFTLYDKKLGEVNAT